jgi:Uma2 family endonuclease
VKGPLYAEAGVGEYWIADLEGEALEVYREPAAQSYRERRRITRGGSIAPIAFPDLVLPLSDILG